MARDETGATTLLVTLVIAFVLIPVLALCVDAGNLYLEKTRLQVAADNAAIAGAKELQVQHNDDHEWHWPFHSDRSGADTSARYFALRNAPEADRVNVTVRDGSVEVVVEKDVALGPARMAGATSPVTVRGHAKAILTWNPHGFDHDHDGEPDEHDYSPYWGSIGATSAPPDGGWPDVTSTAAFFIPKANGFRLYH